MRTLIEYGKCDLTCVAIWRNWEGFISSLVRSTDGNVHRFPWYMKAIRLLRGSYRETTPLHVLLYDTNDKLPQPVSTIVDCAFMVFLSSTPVYSKTWWYWLIYGSTWDVRIRWTVVGFEITVIKVVIPPPLAETGHFLALLISSDDINSAKFIQHIKHAVQGTMFHLESCREASWDWTPSTDHESRPWKGAWFRCQDWDLALNSKVL